MKNSYYTFLVPSKTFLFGEYLALEGGPSLVINTRPYFEMQINFEKNSFLFLDPHQGRGGFGASTAQFLFSWVFAEYRLQKATNDLKKFCSELFVPKTLEKMHQDYRKKNQLEYSGPYEPSGADLISQAVGGLCLFEPQKNFWPLDETNLRRLKKTNDGQLCYETKKYDWVFKKEYDFQILRTGTKQATHKHIKELKSVETENFFGFARKIVSSFKDKNWSDFCKNTRAYYQEMCRQGLVLESSQELVQKWESCEAVECVKACGAMGADTLLVFYKRENKKAIDEWSMVNVLGTELVSLSDDVVEGFCFQSDKKNI